MPSLSYSDYRSSRRFLALDGLRAITVLGLIGHHFQAGSLQPAIGIGKITVFFVLSGFVITLLLLRDEEKNGKLRLRDFYIRRQFRLLPLYYTVLAVYVLARWGFNGEWDRLRDSLPYYLVFMNEFSPVNPDITSFWHSWTLAFEQKFYLVWPLLFLAMSRLSHLHRIWVTVAAAGACLAFIPVTNGWSVYYFSLFLGCVLAMVLHDPRGFRGLGWLTHPVNSVLVIIGFTAIHLYLPTLTGVLGSQRLAFIPYSLAVGLLILALIHNGVGQWILTRQPLLFIGERSYAMYLLHGLAGAAVIGMAPEWGESPVRWLLICVVAVVFADIAHRLVEMPGAARGRQFMAWWRQRDAARAAPSAELVSVSDGKGTP